MASTLGLIIYLLPASWRASFILNHENLLFSRSSGSIILILIPNTTTIIGIRSEMPVSWMNTVLNLTHQIWIRAPTHHLSVILYFPTGPLCLLHSPSLIPIPSIILSSCSHPSTSCRHLLVQARGSCN